MRAVEACQPRCACCVQPVKGICGRSMGDRHRSLLCAAARTPAPPTPEQRRPGARVRVKRGALTGALHRLDVLGFLARVQLASRRSSTRAPGLVWPEHSPAPCPRLHFSSIGAEHIWLTGAHACVRQVCGSQRGQRTGWPTQAASQRTAGGWVPHLFATHPLGVHQRPAPAEPPGHQPEHSWLLGALACMGHSVEPCT